MNIHIYIYIHIQLFIHMYIATDAIVLLLDVTLNHSARESI